MFGVMDLESGIVKDDKTYSLEENGLESQLDLYVRRYPRVKSIRAVPKDYINWWKSGYKCEHEGCFKDGEVECHVPNHLDYTGESLLPKGLELLSTFLNGEWCHNANGNRKGDIVVGSALRKPLFQGQPVNQTNNVDTNILIATISRGTIHLSPKGVEFSLPLDPNVIKSIAEMDTVEYLCQDHAYESGYCILCGDFWGGIEGFDINNPSHMCEHCLEQIQDECCEEDEDEDKNYFWEDDFI